MAWGGGAAWPNVEGNREARGQARRAAPTSTTLYNGRAGTALDCVSVGKFSLDTTRASAREGDCTARRVTGNACAVRPSLLSSVGNYPSQRRQ